MNVEWYIHNRNVKLRPLLRHGLGSVDVLLFLVALCLPEEKNM